LRCTTGRCGPVHDSEDVDRDGFAETGISGILDDVKGLSRVGTRNDRGTGGRLLVYVGNQPYPTAGRLHRRE